MTVVCSKREIFYIYMKNIIQHKKNSDTEKKKRKNKQTNKQTNTRYNTHTYVSSFLKAVVSVVNSDSNSGLRTLVELKYE